MEVAWERRLDLDYLSPAFNAVTANHLGRSDDIEVSFLEPVTRPRREPQRYELLGEEEVTTRVWAVHRGPAAVRVPLDRLVSVAVGGRRRGRGLRGALRAGRLGE